MIRKEALKELDKLLQHCQSCEQRKVPFSPRSHEHRNSYCINQCKDVGPKLQDLGKSMEDITRAERADRKGLSA
jgi:hypothetical protein